MANRFKSKVQAKYLVVAAVDLNAKARTFLDKFFSDFALPLPTFKVVHDANPVWNGRTTYTSEEPNTTTIELQKRILKDERTLDRILAHELIHHADFLINKGSKGSGHGKFFREQAERVNGVLGDNYVTEESDATYVAEDKPFDFYVLIAPSQDGKGLMFAKSRSLTKEQKEYAQSSGGRLVKSKDKKYLKGTADIGKGWSVPKDEAWQEALRALYEQKK